MSEALWQAARARGDAFYTRQPWEQAFRSSIRTISWSSRATGWTGSRGCCPEPSVSSSARSPRVYPFRRRSGRAMKGLYRAGPTGRPLRDGCRAQSADSGPLMGYPGELSRNARCSRWCPDGLVAPAPGVSLPAGGTRSNVAAESGSRGRAGIACSGTWHRSARSEFAVGVQTVPAAVHSPRSRARTTNWSSSRPIQGQPTRHYRPGGRSRGHRGGCAQ